MADLASKLEVTKLSRELGTTEESLDFLTDVPATELRALRTTLTGAIFARHEPRFKRIGGLAKLLPAALTAKIAALAMGPVLSAQIAGTLEAKEAIKLSRQLKPEFLVEVSMHIDPTKVAPIIAGLPPELIVDVGRRLLAKNEHITLGRFVSVVDVEEALGVVEGADPKDLLLVSLYTEDVPSLDAILSRLPDAKIREVIDAALKEDQIEDALTVIGSLSEEGRARLVGQSASLNIGERERMIAAVDRNDVWSDIVTVIGRLPEDALSALVNVPATNDVAVMERVIGAVRDLDIGPTMAPVLKALDEEHLQVLYTVPTLHKPAIQKWIIDNAGDSADLAKQFVAELNAASKK